MFNPLPKYHTSQNWKHLQTKMPKQKMTEKLNTGLFKERLTILWENGEMAITNISSYSIMFLEAFVS